MNNFAHLRYLISPVSFTQFYGWSYICSNCISIFGVFKDLKTYPSCMFRVIVEYILIMLLAHLSSLPFFSLLPNTLHSISIAGLWGFPIPWFIVLLITSRKSLCMGPQNQEIRLALGNLRQSIAFLWLSFLIFMI